MDWKTVKKYAKEVWKFVWESNSPWSWLVNIILAFLLIKFIVYPALGFFLGTTFPIVAVVSGSMEHKTVHPCLEKDFRNHCQKYGISYEICGNSFDKSQSVNFDFYWDTCGKWYEDDAAITKEQFERFPMHNGFNTGDIIVLLGEEPENIKIGDIIVYHSPVKPDPIIHRVVRKRESGSEYYFTTRGDHNDQVFSFEKDIAQENILGKAWIRVPLLGYVKIWFVRLLEVTRIIDLVQALRG